MTKVSNNPKGRQNLVFTNPSCYNNISIGENRNGNALTSSQPSDLLPLLRLSQQQMERQVQLWVALELFRTRKISAGKAAQVAGMSLYEFMDLTRRHDIVWIDYTDDELEAELKKATTLGKAIREQGE
ncbi:MAG TPA: UPF0175 family protein [Anaerolineae bacterium]|jgi:predicted HTH domain antitoxin